MQAAEPVLRALGARLGSEREVIVVPGNHDAALVRPFLRERGMSPAVDAPQPLDATPLLARIASWLAPARVQVRYPGVWLGERIWASHGHYLDRHLLPEVAYGLARGMLGRVPRDDAVPVEYEQGGGPSLTRLEALLTRCRGLWLPWSTTLPSSCAPSRCPACRAACSATASLLSARRCSAFR